MMQLTKSEAILLGSSLILIAIGATLIIISIVLNASL
jgi:hypothetical protein